MLGKGEAALPTAHRALSCLLRVGRGQVLQPREPAEILGNARFHSQESFCWFGGFYVTVMTVCLMEMPIPDCLWFCGLGFFRFPPPSPFFLLKAKENGQIVLLGEQKRTAGVVLDQKGRKQE